MNKKTDAAGGEYFSLLKSWCDGFVSRMLTHESPLFDGGALCPSCKLIHGRQDNMIFPLLLVAERTGESSYAEAAVRLFAWQKNVLRDDGGVYNDSNHPWVGITVFSAVGLCESLHRFGHLIPEKIKPEMKKRLADMGNWLFENLDENTPTNINYKATNAAAMALLGDYFNEKKYTEKARNLLDFMLPHITEAGFLLGEGKPHLGRSPRGCGFVDMGYNMEESMPALVKCALCLKDDNALEKLKHAMTLQLRFMLPDGAWDNSFGTRMNKWTYYGSRTSDGCQGAFGLLALDNPIFAEASLRNLRLMTQCTRDGLLFGGPHYHHHGEKPCIHHTFAHANAVAAAIEAGADEAHCGGSVVSEHEEGIWHYPDIDTYKIAVGGTLATVTANDAMPERGHPTGGTLSVLWHPDHGPVMISGVMDYTLFEPLNMQLPLRTNEHRPLTPRAELMAHGKRFSNAYDREAEITANRNEKGTAEVTVSGRLCGFDGKELQEDCSLQLKYTISPDSVVIGGCLPEDAKFILPVISKKATVKITAGKAETDEIFFLTPGFEAKEYTITPEKNGIFELIIGL